jgi:parallel beta-helix repeat protein
VNIALSGTGVYILNADANTVEECDLSGVRAAVYFGGNSSDNLIQDNVAFNTVLGIGSVGDISGTGNGIIGNDFSNAVWGIYASFGEYDAEHITELLVVKDNVFTAAGTAMYLVGLHDIDLVSGPDFDIDVHDA